MEKWNISDFKEKFQECLDSEQKWRTESKEDYEFLTGKQWKDQDLAVLRELERPALTINRILPMVNVLAGYQRNNRTDIDFLGRNPDDQEGAELRKGITKYVFDDNDFEYTESNVFTDGIVGGRACALIEAVYDPYTLKPKINIEKINPFDVFVDPESRSDNFDDAKYIFRSRWVDKDDLASRYPEKKEIILQYGNEDAESSLKDGGKTERQGSKAKDDKIRLIECWYKRAKKKEAVMNADGTVEIREPKSDMDEMGYEDISYKSTVQVPQVYMCIYFGNEILEHRESPYLHGEFPYAFYTGYFFGNDDVPAGIVRHLKDVQRFGNKTISQQLDIQNRQINSATRVSPAVPEEEVRKIEKDGTKPGIVIRADRGDVEPISPPPIPAHLINMFGILFDQITNINGLNPDFLASSDASKNTSGRAIELRQKTAVTHIAQLLDNLKRWKKHITYLLWGDEGRPGIIPQYFTEEMYFRIYGKNGKYEFVKVNEETLLIDQTTGMPIYDPASMKQLKTIKNSLENNNFDIVITDSPMSATARNAQMDALVGLGGQIGLSQNPMLQPIVFKAVIEISDIPSMYKDSIIKALDLQIALNEANIQQQVAGLSNQMNQNAPQPEPQGQMPGGIPPELEQMISMGYTP